MELIDLRKKIVKEFDVKTPCNFQNGECRYYKHLREGIESNNRYDKMGGKTCCCHGCKDTRGYSSRILYPKYWGDNGYYDPETGCMLPRHLRSSVCLGFRCWIVSQELDKKFIYKLNSMTILLGAIDRMIEYSLDDKKSIESLKSKIAEERVYLL